jgi:hypothetical protein
MITFEVAGRSEPALKAQAMAIAQSSRSAFKPRWDGQRVLFTVGIGGVDVACAISRAALETLTGASFIRPRDIVLRFAEQRARIEAIAASILAVRPESVTGTLHIWSDDIENPPDEPTVAQTQVAIPA